MSVTFSIKGVPDDVAARLRERADRHHRSLQGELLAIIEAAATGAAPAAAGAGAGAGAGANAIVGIDRRGHPIVRKGMRRIEEVAAELAARTPRPRDGAPRSVDIVREARDSR